MRSFNASTAADLEPIALVMAEVQRCADESSVDIMVVGAAARDILIRHIVGSLPERATADIDVAVAVASWSDLRRRTGSFAQLEGSEHKFEVQQTEVDVIPFGDIESSDQTITWPDDHRMNVFGFSEAMAAAVQVTLPGDVAILPGLELQHRLGGQGRYRDGSPEHFDLLPADMGGRVGENRSLLAAYRDGFA